MTQDEVSSLRLSSRSQGRVGCSLLHGNREVQMLLQMLLCDSKEVSPGGFRVCALEPFAQDDTS